MAGVWKKRTLFDMFVSAKCRARGWNLVQLVLDVINGSLDVVVFLDNHHVAH